MIERVLKENAVAAYALVLMVGLVAGVVSGVIATGSSIVLLPILVPIWPQASRSHHGDRALMANIARVAAWWHEVDRRAFAAYALPGMPPAALGARTLLLLPSHVVDIALGAFYLAMIPARRRHQTQNF